jgi:para-aminobenzoate synthetase component 1
MLVRPLDGSASAEDVLRRLATRARKRGLPPPAALTGQWFGGSTVLAPSVAVSPVSDAEALTTLDAQPTVSGPEGAVGGGWIGYLGYGLTDPGHWTKQRQLPRAAWGWADHVLRRDPEGQWWFESLCSQDRALALHTSLVDVVDGQVPPPGRSWNAGPVATPDDEQHCKAVRRCIEEIASGEIFQANICSRFSVPFDGDPCSLFAGGSERFHPARAAFVAGGWGSVISLSPELFLARRGKTVLTSPIKGTMPRRGPHDDDNAQRLRDSAKDVAENVMIVDMARNDLGRVAEAGTVTVPELLDVQPHPGVWHLVSEVRAKLPEGTPHSTLLEVTFPPASVTGAPKIRALDVIADLESEPREVYCGSVGMASPVAGLELNVAIRTLEHAGAALHFGVGGGITADSDPRVEWEECLTKAAPMLSLLTGR